MNGKVFTKEVRESLINYIKGGCRGEVKNWSRPVDRTTLIRLHRKGINEVISKKGFTEPAK